MSHQTTSRRALTIVEMLVVIGVIVFLSGILLAALTAVKGSGKQADSMNRMRQIAQWMGIYSTDNRDQVLPARFDYSAAGYTGKVRSIMPAYGGINEGTWADILWTQNGLGESLSAIAGAGTNQGETEYIYDSPDKAFYDEFGNYGGNPLRSAALNTNGLDGGAGATPFADGADEEGEPGYFAANLFFDSREDANGWFVNGQIRQPDRSLYLIDSFAGETIGGQFSTATGWTWDRTADYEDMPAYRIIETDGSSGPGEVDFRYSGICLILLLDGHIDTETEFENLEELEGLPNPSAGEDDPGQNGRGIRVRNLTKRR